MSFAKEAGYKVNDSIISARDVEKIIIEVMAKSKRYDRIWKEYSAEERGFVFDECVSMIRQVLEESQLIAGYTEDILRDVIERHENPEDDQDDI